MSIDRNAAGAYKLACEASPNKQQIDIWINEGKTITWISEELKKIGDYISTNSIGKYKKYRDNLIQKELENTPDFQAKQKQATEMLNDKIGEIKAVDLLGNLSMLIEDSAEMLSDAKDRNVQINNAKDMRLIQQTMLDAISIYGDTMIKAQQFDEINKNPDLLRRNNTTINVTIKDALTDILKGAMDDGKSGYDIIDRLREGTGISNGE